MGLTFCNVARLTSRLRLCGDPDAPPPIYPFPAPAPPLPSSCSVTRSHSLSDSELVASTSRCSGSPCPAFPRVPAARLPLNRAGANRTALGGYRSGARATARKALVPRATRWRVEAERYAVSESESESSSRSPNAGSTAATVRWFE